MVLAAAVTFARADQSLRVADDAAAVRDAEGGSTAAATYRANLTIAVVAAATESGEAASRAFAAASRALERVASAAARLPGDELSQAIVRLASSHSAVALDIEEGSIEAIDTRVSTETLQILDEIQARFGKVTAEASARIEAERAAAGKTARFSSFVVALIAPAFGLWAFRRNARRRLERERLASELARQRDLADAQQGLISGLSHQLRTPLTGIYGFAEALVTDPNPDRAFVAEAGQTILVEANRLRGMVDDILVTARVHAGDLAFEETAFDLATEVANAVEPFLRTGASITVECPAVTVMGDRLRVRHVLRNLIDNAIRHGAGAVRVLGERDRGYRIAIEDEGPGPAGDDVFRSFAHTPDDALVTGSLGLGLGVCRALCDGMGLSLDWERADGVTRFVLDWDAARVARDQTPARTGV
jgi:signal transduction histidine kinase